MAELKAATQSGSRSIDKHSTREHLAAFRMIGENKVETAGCGVKISSGEISRTVLSAVILFALAAIIGAGCKTPTSLPPQDLNAPGWTILRGQAVWKPPHNRPEVAGDLLMATNASGNFFIVFSKSPFVIATAQVENEQWEIRFSDEKYAWRGGGIPPDRFIWFQLPHALLGERLTDDWQFNDSVSNLWRLQDTRTGEKLEGEFFQ